MAQRVDTKQPRNNAGALFRNVRKSKETHPDYNGECLIDGKEYFIAGWARESKNGNRYTSLAFTLKGSRHVQERTPGSDDDKNEDLPP